MNEKSYTFSHFFVEKTCLEACIFTSEASFQKAEPQTVPLITNQIETSRIPVADLVKKSADACGVFLRMIPI